MENKLSTKFVNMKKIFVFGTFSHDECVTSKLFVESIKKEIEKQIFEFPKIKLKIYMY
jgi:hypothetical protein